MAKGSINSPLGTMQWLSNAQPLLNSKCSAGKLWFHYPELLVVWKDLLKPQVYLNALAFRTVSLVSQSAAKLQEELSSHDPFTAWNNTQTFFLQSAAKSYIEYLVVLKFVEKINSVNEASLKQVLNQLCHLFGT